MTQLDASRLQIVLALDKKGRFKTAFIGTNPAGAKKAMEELALSETPPEYIALYTRPRIAKAWDRRRQNEIARSLKKNPPPTPPTENPIAESP